MLIYTHSDNSIFYINVDNIAFMSITNEEKSWLVSIQFTGEGYLNLLFDNKDAALALAKDIYTMGAEMYNERVGKHVI